ncbi:MAG: DNA polymerase III subunit gamma/tau [Gammaproteobacteria bacterium]|nr:DNA polymerase III subunit gamma/tau [Gammaproteobacteria bacterium]
MSYQVLARKWRPANFQQMVGQEHILQALVNALDSNRLHHAYLFAGTRGVGKTTIARIFAKSLNCDQGISSEPCGSCSSCLEVDEGRSVDLIEIDAASRTGVEDMRELLDNVQYAPTRGRFKIYLIDEVHMLSKHSFNALLKTLEEPPPHVKFLLATTDPQKVPVTVLSRCLQFNLKRMSRSQILSQLQFLTEQEAVDADAAALGQLAGAADGSMRDALSLLDQAIGYGGGAVKQAAVESMLGSISRDYLQRLFDALMQQQAAVLLREARTIIEHNPDYQRVCAEMLTLLQQIALHQRDPSLVDEHDFPLELLQQYSAAWSPDEVQLYYQIMLQGRHDLQISPDEAAGFEMLMLRLIAFAPESESLNETDEVKKKPELNPDSFPQAGSAPIAGVDASRAQELETGEDRVAPAVGESPVDIALVEKSSPRAKTEESSRPESEVDVIAPDPAESVTRIKTPKEIDTEAIVAVPEATESDCRHSADLDWSSLAYNLGLIGLAQEIVANSRLEYCRDGKLKLALLPEIHELVNALIESEIRQALEQKLEVSLQLDLTAADTLSGETPLQAKMRRLEQERLTAIEAIRGDASVLKLQQALAAELDEQSVVKIDNISK